MIAKVIPIRITFTLTNSVYTIRVIIDCTRIAFF